MSIYAATNNALITPLVDTALSHPAVIEVVKQTMGSQWFIQQMGPGATVLDVEAHFTKAQKLQLDVIKRAGASIKVIFDERYYIGPIGEEIEYERIKSATEPMFRGTFKVLVNEEGVS